MNVLSRYLSPFWKKEDCPATMLSISNAAKKAGCAINFALMITYNPKDWFTFIFRFHNADTLRKLLPMIIGISLYCAGIAYLELEYLRWSKTHWASNITIMHTLLSFVISMLLVFRTNSAYDRWWEGVSCGGQLVNNSRNLAIKLHCMPGPEREVHRKFFCRTIPLFASVLATHLRAEKTRLALDEQEHPDLKEVDENKHLPNQVAALIIGRVNRLYEEGTIKGDQLIVLNSQMQSLTDISGACERIKNTPIPFLFSAFLKKFIFFYVMTLPLSLVFSLRYVAIPVVAFIFYVLASLELITEEIEDHCCQGKNSAFTKNSKKGGETVLKALRNKYSRFSFSFTMK